MTNWIITSALADEIDAALSLALSDSFRDVVPSFEAATESLSEDWYEQGRDLLEGLSGEFFSLLSRLATPLGVTFVDDYSELTLKLRGTTAVEVADAARECALEHGMELSSGGDAVDTLEEFVRAMRTRTGLRYAADGEVARLHRRECELAVSVCAQGSAHAAFWHWLDRFFYEIYQPFRRERVDYMQVERGRAIAELGGEQGEGLPELSWLPDKNPLARENLLKKAVNSSKFDIYFWVEPFGLWDMVGLLPEGLLVSFANPGEAFESFRARAESISEKLKIIADPTRLAMLRLMRQLEVDNSEIADYFGVSHPTVSVHAKILREAGLIESRREGRRLFHTIDPDELRTLIRELESFLGLPNE